MPAASDRNLLFGILALQMNFVTRDALVAAMNTWVLDKHKPLGHILGEQGAFGQTDYDVVEAVVARYVANHDGDIQKSLQSLPSLGSVREALALVPDSDVHASLRLAPATADPDLHPSRFQALPTAAAEPGMRYRVLRPHARGGLGEVFVAEDTELHRQVALKEIQEQYADQPLSRERFVIEAEITGGLEHPGIVPVYGLGVRGNGRPYYAMRFIQGDSLKDAIRRFHSQKSNATLADERNLQYRALLGRFVTACNAIAYAHSRGVLHRDVKPANIMLGKYGETLVVDWGLAKTVGSEGIGDLANAGEPTLRVHSGSSATRTGAIAGTPAYMSPEQAAGQPDLGPASDVYSLGATLYTLLTGRVPFGGDSSDEVLRKVRGGEFAGPRTVKPSASKVLEAVCLKAMALRPQRRYASAVALAADVERWLADEAVTAYREPISVRLRRWGRRNRTLVVGLAALVLTATAALAVGFAVVSAQKAQVVKAEADTRNALNKVTEEQKKTATALEKSRVAETLALDTVKSVVNDIHEELKDRPALQELRKKLLKTAEDGLKKVARNADTVTEIDHATIWVHFELGDIFLHIDGATEEARKQYELAHTLVNELIDANQGNAEARRDLSVSLEKLGDVQLRLGDSKQALDRHRQARDLRQKLADDDPNNARARRDLAASLHNLGDVQLLLGDTKQALDSHRQARDLRQKLADDDPNNARALRDLAASLNYLGGVQTQLGDTKQALDSHRQARDMSQKLADEDPNNARARRDLAASLHNLGGVQLLLGDSKQALDSHRQARDIRQKLADEDPNNARAWRDLAASLHNLGGVQLLLGDSKQALDSHRQARDISQKLADEDVGNAEARRGLSVSLHNLSAVQLLLGDTKQALDSLRQARDLCRKLADDDKGNAEARRDLAASLHILGVVQLRLGDSKQARDSLRQARDLCRKLADDDKGNAEARRGLSVSLQTLGGVQLLLGDTKQALDSLRQARDLRQKLADEDKGNAQVWRDLAASFEKLGDVQLLLGDSRQALDSYRQALDLFKVLSDADQGNAAAQRDLSITSEKLGDVQLLLGDSRQALNSYRQARDIRQKLADDNKGNAQVQRDLAASLHNLGDVQLRLGDSKQALDSHRQARDLRQKLADDDKGNAEAQRDLSISLSRVGDMQLLLGDSHQALDSHRQARDIFRVLSGADQGNAAAQRDLFVSLLKLGEVQLRLGDSKQALDSLRQALVISKKLADAHKGNAQAQHDLTVSLLKLGDVQLRLGDTKQALDDYRQALDIRQKLADDEKGNVKAQTDLFICYRKLGSVEKTRFEYAKASSWFGKGRAVLEPLHTAGKLSGQFQNAVAMMDREIAFCEAAEKSIADLEFALKQPEEIVSQLLNARGKFWHQKGKPAEVAATADKLRTLPDLPKQRPGGNLYNAACAYALASACADADEKTKEAHAAKAVALLQEARDKGLFKGKAQVEHAKKDADLDPLRPRDDFKALLAELEKDAK